MESMLRFKEFKSMKEDASNNDDLMLHTIVDTLEVTMNETGAKNWFEFASNGKNIHGWNNEEWMDFISKKTEASNQIVDTAISLGYDIKNREQSNESGRDLVRDQVKVLIYKNKEKTLNDAANDILKLLQGDEFISTRKAYWQSSAFNSYKKEEMGELRNLT